MALKQAKKYSEAIASFSKVISFFDDFANDEFDFHQYVPRKGTFEKYVATVEYHNRIFYDEQLVDATIYLLQCFYVFKVKLDSQITTAEILKHASKLEKIAPENEYALITLYASYQVLDLKLKAGKCFAILKTKVLENNARGLSALIFNYYARICPFTFEADNFIIPRAFEERKRLALLLVDAAHLHDEDEAASRFLENRLLINSTPK